MFNVNDLFCSVQVRGDGTFTPGITRGIVSVTRSSPGVYSIITEDDIPNGVGLPIIVSTGTPSIVGCGQGALNEWQVGCRDFAGVLTDSWFYFGIVRIAGILNES